MNTAATDFALKEWAVVIDALLRGDQVITLRKGGIRERSFAISSNRFYLLPSFAHQAEALVKTEERAALSRSATQSGDHGLIVQAHAELVESWQIEDAQQVAALAPFQVTSGDYLRARFDWRQEQPLTVLLLRVRRLTAPWRTGLPAGTGGCRSWLEIDACGAPAVGAAVLADAAFAAAAARVRAALHLGAPA